MSTPDDMKLLLSINQGDDGDGPFLQVTSGQLYTGRYDKLLRGATVLWRGDTRAPEAVFKTGFSSRFVRDGKGKEIVWRCRCDDIVPESAVCLARDIRGAAFFPYPPSDTDAVNDSNYLYAIVVARAASTYNMQQVAERAETGKHNWRDEARFPYDPTWSNQDGMSCVWQFAEYAVHEVAGRDVLAGWKCDRQFLIKMKDDERVQGGIKFRLKEEVLNKASPYLSACMKAQQIAHEYYQPYPKKWSRFLSYFGLVDNPLYPVRSKENAVRTSVQVSPIVVESDNDWNVREDGGNDGGGQIIRL